MTIVISIGKMVEPIFIGLYNTLFCTTKVVLTFLFLNKIIFRTQLIMNYTLFKKQDTVKSHKFKVLVTRGFISNNQ